MTNASAQKRIFFNALIVVVRVAVTIVATVFATRFALQALGVNAFGVYVVTASLPLLASFLTAAMGGVTQRMLTTGFASDASDRQRIFNASLGPHLVVALILVIIGETLGIWLLDNALSIPFNLRDAARFALRITVAAMALGAFLAPYEVLLRARERFALFAALDILRALTVVVGSYWLLDYSGDRLVGYAALQAGATAGVTLCGALIASYQFSEARIQPLMMIDRTELRQRWGLFSWSIFGSLAVISRYHGFVVLANVFFGPTASAALGIGNQLLGVLRQLTTAVSLVVEPKIFKLEASGERALMVSVVFRVCKYGALFGAVLVAPLITELQTVLVVWLGSPPPGTFAVVMPLAAAFLLDQLSFSAGAAHLAIGQIRTYQLICGLIGISAIPIGYFLGVQGGGLSVVLLSLVGTSGLVAAIRVLMLESHEAGAFRLWLKVTVVPVFLGLTAALLVAFAVTHVLEPSFGRVFATTIASFIALLTVVIVGLDVEERKVLDVLILRRFTR